MLPNGYPALQAQWPSSTGRVYTFIQQPAPKFMQDKGIYGSISPTQVANYPMQGFATGDVVPEVLGRLYDMIYRPRSIKRGGITFQQGILMINTIHDSVLFDVHKEWLDTACVSIRSCMSRAPTWMRERYGVEIDLPMKVDVEYGHNWADMKKYHF